MFFIFPGIGWFDSSRGMVTLDKDRKVDLFPPQEPFGGEGFRNPAGQCYALRKATNQVFVCLSARMYFEPTRDLFAFEYVIQILENVLKHVLFTLSLCLH